MSLIKRYAGKSLDLAMKLVETASPAAAFRVKRHFLRPDMSFGLRLLQRNGFAPDCCLDVGAHRGEWALLCRQIFPTSRVLMLEPSPERVARLRGLCARDQNLAVIEALVGSVETSVLFLEQDSNSAVASRGTPGAVAMATKPLDSLLAGSPFAQPQLLKVDVQGYDLEVMKGAVVTLASVEVVVIEVSLIPLNPMAPPVLEIVKWMDDHGFRLLDICGFIRRPSDDALWQIDAVFARKESRLGNVSGGW